jgi:hypothetical protein
MQQDPEKLACTGKQITFLANTLIKLDMHQPGTLIGIVRNPQYAQA